MQLNEITKMKNILNMPRGKENQTFKNRLYKNKYLYFIKCGDAVKIGVSSDPESRMKILATGSPGELKLLAIIPNMGNLESSCHRRLSHLHLCGEWYLYNYETETMIKELLNER